MFPKFEFTWVLPEFERAILTELDFREEAKNGDRARENFKNNPEIKIPDIHYDLSGRKVLTMEFIYGIKINDKAALQKAGFDPFKVAKMLIECFSKQIYEDGWIHSDPHPGNLLIRRDQAGETQLVVLDHGLYQEFPDKERIWYCKLWKAIVLRNNEEIEKYGRKLGCGEFSHIFALLLSFRPPSNKDIGMTRALTPEDIKDIKAQFKGMDRSDGVEMINRLLESMPRSILFVLRTTNLLRSINKELGAEVNRFLLMARCSLKGVYAKKEGLYWRILEWLLIVRFEVSFYMFQMLLKIQNYFPDK